MEENSKLLIPLLENILGPSETKSSGNRAFHCPFCNHHKKKLEINIQGDKEGNNSYHCWVCDTKGKKLSTLFKKLNVSQKHWDELKLISPKYKQPKTQTNNNQNKILYLPKGFFTLLPLNEKYKNESLEAIRYLEERGINQKTIYKYNIGVTLEDENYKNRIIIPSYDINNKLNYFISRLYKGYGQKYKNPPIDKDNIIFENNINFDAPIILVEGVFDSLTFPRNTIPLLGKTIPKKLFKRILEKGTKKIYIALDPDAINFSIKHIESFIKYNKEVYLVKLEGKKDINEIGFNKFLNIIEDTEKITFSDLIKLKLK